MPPPRAATRARALRPSRARPIASGNATWPKRASSSERSRSPSSSSGQSGRADRQLGQQPPRCRARDGPRAPVAASMARSRRGRGRGDGAGLAGIGPALERRPERGPPVSAGPSGRGSPASTPPPVERREQQQREGQEDEQRNRRRRAARHEIGAGLRLQRGIRRHAGQHAPHPKSHRLGRERVDGPVGAEEQRPG